jgi:hypothetical protein
MYAINFLQRQIKETCGACPKTLMHSLLCYTEIQCLQQLFGPKKVPHGLDVQTTQWSHGTDAAVHTLRRTLYLSVDASLVSII